MGCIKITVVLLFCCVTARAQTFAEWFKQKSTQKKYLSQQIAALRIYSSYLQKGYGIARGGLGSIGGYIRHEFELHDAYYTRLKTAGAAVKSDPQVSDILRWQQDILKQTRWIKAQSGLTSGETTYVHQFCRALLNDCDARLNDLQVILTDQQTSLSDEERLRQLDRLHAAMQENYRFAAGFRSELQVYVRNKTQASRDLNTLNHLYGNP